MSKLRERESKSIEDLELEHKAYLETIENMKDSKLTEKYEYYASVLFDLINEKKKNPKIEGGAVERYRNQFKQK